MSEVSRFVSSKGFTLLELTVVLLIVGVIAAVAAPRYVDLAESAKQAKVRSIAQSLGSGSTLNFAASVAAEQSWLSFP